MAVPDREWICSAKAAEALGVSRSRLRRTAAPLGIRVREFPGVRGELYHAGDVRDAGERLDRAAVERIAAARATTKTAERTGRPANETARTAG